MQDFDEYIFQPSIAADGVIVAPTGDGAEPFIHADDIADVAAITLLERRPGEFTLSGPEALTFAQVAERISRAAGRTVTTSTRRSPSGWPRRRSRADYAALLGMLFDNLRAGRFGERHGRRRARDRPRAAQLRRLRRRPRRWSPPGALRR